MRFGILLLLGLMLSCGTQKNTAKDQSAAALELSGKYQIVTLNGKSVADKGLEITFDTQASAVNGTTGCNKIFGGYTQSGSQLSFAALGATKMYCQDGMELEQEMLQGLGVINAISSQKDGAIALMNNDQMLMQLQKID